MPAKTKKKTSALRITKKEKLALLHLAGCGSSLANIAYNLAQHDSAKEYHPTLNRWRKEWDVAYCAARPILCRLG